MSQFPQANLARFLKDENGAVTVDWVVLTAAIVGLGMATVTVVASGVGTLSNETADEIGNVSIMTRFAETVDLLTGDFGSGRMGFTGGTLTSASGFGDILQIGQDEMVELTLDVPPGSESATIEFDLIAADDFDGDTATVWINGQQVSFYTDNEGSISITDGGVAGISVSVDQQYTNSNQGGGSLGDSRATYSITVDNPGTSLTFGVSSDASADAGNEYFAIDDVSVTAQ